MGRIALLLTCAYASLVGDAMFSDKTNAEIAQHAVQEFQRGVELRGARDKAIPHFQIASRCFEELRRRGVCNPELYRDLGNASLLADDVPLAVLSYRRGLRLAPTDPDLKAGLNEARDRVAYATTGDFGRPPEDHGLPWLPRLGSYQLMVAAVVCYAACCFCATRWLMTRRVFWMVSAVIALSMTAALAAPIVVGVRLGRETEKLPLVVIAEDGVLLRKGDGLTYPAKYDAPLNKGMEARRLYERGDWSQIELSGGQVGWARRDWLLVDEP